MVVCIIMMILMKFLLQIVSIILNSENFNTQVYKLFIPYILCKNTYNALRVKKFILLKISFVFLSMILYTMMPLIANIHIAELTKWSFFDYVQTLHLIFPLQTKTCFYRSFYLESMNAFMFNLIL